MKPILLTMLMCSFFFNLIANDGGKKKLLIAQPAAANPPAQGSAVFLRANRISQGAWEGKYGSDGYILFGYGADAEATDYEHKKSDLVQKPAYLDDYNFSWGGGYWRWDGIQNGNPTILNKPAVLPPGVNGDKQIVTASRGDQPYTEFMFDINDDLEHVFSLYTNTAYSTTSTIRIELFNYAGDTLSDIYVDKNVFDGGGYLSFLVKGSFRIKLQTQTGFGVQGFFFDSPLNNQPAAFDATYNTLANTAVLNWSNPSTPDGVLIERSDDNILFRNIAETAGSPASYTDASILTARKYYYRIRNRYGTTFGLASDVDSIIVPVYQTTRLTSPAASVSTILNQPITLQVKLEDISTATPVPIAGKTISFMLQGTGVGDGSSAGQEIPGSLGTAVTNANGEASITYNAAFAGSFTVVAKFATDPSQQLNGSVVEIGLRVTSPWTKAPVILKISDAVSAGSSFTMNGAGIDPSSIIAIAPDLNGSSPTTPPSYAIRPAIVQTDSNGNYIVSKMPVLLPNTVYNVWVKNRTGWSKCIKLNAARPLFLSEYEAAAGVNLRLVGRNFDQREFGGNGNTKVRLNDGAGKRYEAAINELNPYQVRFKVPANAEARTYFIEITNDGGRNWQRLDNGQKLKIVSKGADPLGLDVSWAADFKWNNQYNVTAYGAIANDSLDDTYAVQSAVDAAEQAGGGVVYFPNGKYHIKSVQLGAGVVLLGQHMYNTKLYYTGNDNRNFINSKGKTTASPVTQLQGVARLSLLLADSSERPDAFMWLAEPWGEGGVNNFGEKALRSANRIFVSEVNIDYPVMNKGRQGTGRGMAIEFIAKERVLLQKNHFKGYGATNLVTAVNEYVTIRDNYYEYAVGYVHCMTSYSFYTSNKVVIHPESNEDSHGLFARANAYMADNEVSGAGAGNNSHNDGEGISVEPPGGAFNFGRILQASSTSITVSPNKPLVANQPLEYGYLSVIITNGRGLGQSRRVVQIDPASRVITLDRPFDIIPDSAGMFTLVTPLENFTVYKNKLENCAKGIWPFGLQHDCVIADNKTVNSQGIFQFAARNDEQNVNYANNFTRITRNTVTGVSRRDNYGGIALYTGRFGFPGFSGVQSYAVEILDNKVTGDNTLNPGSSGTEAAPVSGIAVISFGHSTQTNGIGGDVTNIILEGNKLSNLKKGISLTKGDYGNIVFKNQYDCSVLQFLDNQESVNTIIANNSNTSFTQFKITKPVNGSVVSYVNGKLEIASTSMTCSGPLSKSIYIKGVGLDTVFTMDGATASIYVDSFAFRPDTWYAVYGKIADGNDTAVSNLVVFKTPKQNTTAFRVFPNPASGTVHIQADNASTGLWNVQLFTLDGRQVLNTTRQLSQGIVSLDISTYRSGLYMLVISKGTERLTYRLVILERQGYAK